ncbi:DUF4150 domain-containing protein [Agrobacterium sp. DKPNP3]|uniref:DUF4150 domain-containing protein n=1 Tax=Agrobacterium sp. DKPNP3 TaxID=3457323 RepID=UPI004044477E
MKETIRINGITLCHKNSKGYVRSTLPDVCLTPPKPLPVPYTNTAFARDLADGTTTVFSHGGAMNGVRGSRFAKSIGDEPGSSGGVKSGTHLHEATFLSWSPNVFMQGRAVTRLTDKMLLNKGNTVSVGGYKTDLPEGHPERYLCEVGCRCYALHRPRNSVTEGLEWMDQVLPRDDEASPGRYQRCVDATIQAQYPNTVLGGSMPVGDPRTNYGYISELGFWDPNNPKNTFPDKPPGNIILQGEEHDVPKVPRRAPWGGTRWFNVRGSRWLDVVKVENGQMTHMYDMKFPGDKFPNDAAKDDAYRAIARRYRARYREFVVLDECDNCEESVRQREQERQWEAEERWRQLKKGLENAPPIWLPLPGPRIPGGRRPPVPSW